MARFSNVDIGKSQTGPPPAAKADDTRKRIVGAAREVFSERGYDGATFQAIAVRADLTSPAINHYFASKRGLYREVVDQTNELVVAPALNGPSGDHPDGATAVFISFA